MRPIGMGFISYMIACGLLFCSNDHLNNNSKTLFISIKNIDTLIQKDSLWLKTSVLTWKYDTSSAISNLQLYIKGRTNSKNIGIERYGDGVYVVQKLNISENNFEDSIDVAFRYGSEEFLNLSTNLILHFLSNNDSIKILVKNPL